MAKYYYNGVLLPKIPAADYDSYSYIMILQNSSGNVYIYATNSKPYYQRKSSVDRLELPGGRTRSLFNAELNVWGDPDTSESSTYCDLSSKWSIIWSGFDIPSGSASATAVYFYGSMPVEAYDRKYLIRSGSTLYTITDGTLSALNTTNVTSSLFQTYGVDDLPDGSLLVGLTDPEVLYWHDSTDELPTLSLTVKGTPPLPQMFTSEPMDLTHESIAGIDHAAVDASEDVRFAISFDDGASWQAFDGSAWFQVSDTAPGMLASTMNDTTAEQWAEVVQLTAYRLRFWLPNVTAFVKSVVIHYINP